MRWLYELVYQCGIANVFRVEFSETGSVSGHKLIYQGTFGQAEWFCRGLIEATADVSVWHSDVAGDVLLCAKGPWQEGRGDMFRTAKNPPGLCLYADR